MDPVFIFLLVGVFSMSAALSAGALNKLPEEQKPAFLQSQQGLVFVMVLGNVSALTLIGALAYGFSRLDWWIPLSSVFVSFPVAHFLVLHKLGDLRNVFISGAAALISIPVLYVMW